MLGAARGWHATQRRRCMRHRLLPAHHSGGPEFPSGPRRRGGGWLAADRGLPSESGKKNRVKGLAKKHCPGNLRKAVGSFLDVSSNFGQVYYRESVCVRTPGPRCLRCAKIARRFRGRACVQRIGMPISPAPPAMGCRSKSHRSHHPPPSAAQRPKKRRKGRGMPVGGGDGGGVAATGGAAEYQGKGSILTCFFFLGLNLLLRLPPPPTALPFSPAGMLQ
jgi:hypothetical protein